MADRTRVAWVAGNPDLCAANDQLKRQYVQALNAPAKLMAAVFAGAKRRPEVPSSRPSPDRLRPVLYRRSRWFAELFRLA
jgi:hypothetical protein